MKPKGELIITSEGLTKSYGNLTALDSIDLRIPAGSVGLLGPNGAGKSTLIKSLLGLIGTDGGSAEVLGVPVSNGKRTIATRRKFGYMPESECLLPDQDAVSFISLMGEMSGLPAMTSMQRAHEVLHYVGIGDERYRKIGTYSTGMKQKVKLCQAIVHDPELIFLDEPTNGMDPKGRMEMLELVRDISHNHGKNVIFSSHLLPDVEFVCDHVLIMNHGTLLMEGNIRELTRSAERLEVRIKDDPERFGKLLADLGYQFEVSGSLFIITTDEDSINRLISGARSVGVQVRHATRGKRTLEDIFVSRLRETARGGP